MEFLFEDVEGGNILYRKDHSITFPVEKMITSSASGVPILALELVLLYKSRKPEDDPSAASDFKNALSELSFDSRSWLAAALRKIDPEHVLLKDL